MITYVTTEDKYKINHYKFGRRTMKSSSNNRSPRESSIYVCNYEKNLFYSFDL